MEELKSLGEENNKLEENPNKYNPSASLEEAQADALMSLAETAASLSRAVNKIAAYVPTQWVDNSEPSINANNLMHIENGIRDATTAVNNAIDAITEINGNIQGIDSKLIRGNGYTALEVLNDNGTIYRMQLSANGGLVHLYEDSGSGWNRTDSLALKSDLSDVLKPAGTANLNANNVKNLGIYDVLQSNNTENYPTDDGNGILLVFAYNPNRIAQMFIYFDGTMWTRMYWHGTWRSWLASNNA